MPIDSLPRALRTALLPILLLLLLAPSAGALPQVYGVVGNESNVATTFSYTAQVDAQPDFLNTFPQASNLLGTSNTQPSGLSTATADVGLPGNLQTTIDISDLVIDLPSVGSIFSIGQITVPLSITGSPTQDIAFLTTIGSFRITLDDPISSSLTPSGNPNEFLWASLANVTISGVANPALFIPTDAVPPVPLDPTPFSQSATIPLAGTFSGDLSGTRLTVGIPVDGIDDLDLSAPEVNDSIDLLDLGLVTLDVRFRDLILAELTGAVVYESSVPIPEPGTATLLGLGLAGLSAARRRRR